MLTNSKKGCTLYVLLKESGARLLLNEPIEIDKQAGQHG